MFWKNIKIIYRVHIKIEKGIGNIGENLDVLR
jgi:hypothetical protein